MVYPHRFAEATNNNIKNNINNNKKKKEKNINEDSY